MRPTDVGLAEITEGGGLARVVPIDEGAYTTSVLDDGVSCHDSLSVLLTLKRTSAPFNGSLNHKAHAVFTKKLCPDIPVELIDEVNSALDAASHDLGPRHREVNHDPISAAAAGLAAAARLHLPADMGVRAAYAHLLADRVSDRFVEIPVAKGVFGQNISAKKIFDLLTG